MNGSSKKADIYFHLEGSDLKVGATGAIRRAARIWNL